MVRGMGTLIHMRSLLNPFRYGLFAWMLFTHKICRWLVPWAGLLGVAGIALLSWDHLWARALLLIVLVSAGVGMIAWRSGRDHLPKVVALPTYGLMGNLAAIHATVRALRGEQRPIWEPTRR
jgi:hypothetical protein